MHTCIPARLDLVAIVRDREVFVRLDICIVVLSVCLAMKSREIRRVPTNTSLHMCRRAIFKHGISSSPGFVEKDELADLLRAFGLNPTKDEIDSIMKELDTDQSGGSESASGEY